VERQRWWVGSKRRESSKRNHYIISPRVITKAIIIIMRRACIGSGVYSIYITSSTTLVNLRFQEMPLQDIQNFTGKVTVPGVGPKTVERLLECNITTPSALVGQFMVSCMLLSRVLMSANRIQHVC